jgi:hypothetical protein
MVALLIGVAPVAMLSPLFVSVAAAQSITASVFGTIYDEQRGVLPGAAVTLTDLATGQIRSTTSSNTSTFRLVGLSPGRHELTVELAALAKSVTDIELSVGEELETFPTLRLATRAETTTVVADQALTRALEIALGRTIGTKQIDELPVASRDFTTLALLTPGILENHSSGLGSSAGIEAAGRTGHSTGFVLDGLTLDDMQASNIRGTVSLDAVQEFLVLSNGFSAEYGQAAGAMVSILTRAGTNHLAGRISYYHRDDAWDATPAAARLVIPSLSKSKLAQKILSGFLGGPLVRDRLFFFGSAEDTLRDTENIVTSPLLSTFRPGALTHPPVRSRNPLVLGRGDANLSASDLMTVRYRLSQGTQSPYFGGSGLGAISAPEKGADALDRNQDAAITTTHVWGSQGLHEFRSQFARRVINLEPTRSCPGCPPDGPQEDRPGIFLGKNANQPSSVIENRWQVADSVTWFRSGPFGDHAFKTGVDASAVGVKYGVVANGAVFHFATNQPFDPATPATYPDRYTSTTRNPVTREATKLLALFTQDEWRTPSQVTLNLGLRWDYQAAPGVSHEIGKVSPRLGVAWALGKTGRTVLRASYGLYYDQVFLRMAHDAEAAKTTVQWQLDNPGYPDPLGENTLRTTGPITPLRNTVRLADDLLAPYTAQATVGAQREIGFGIAVSADGVLARGYHLFFTHDLNYPDLTDPARARPDPSVGKIAEVQSRGHSRYHALQVSVEKRHTHRYSFTAAYTLSSSQGDTEDYDFVAQDQRNQAEEWGPSLGDARHRLAGSVNVDVPLGLRVTAITTAQSALPYNVTTGVDTNRDGYVTDRPAGLGRNAARGAAFWQTNARLSKAFRIQSTRFEVLAEVFNLANRPNWTMYDGKRSNVMTFGRPTASGDPRQVQLGIRVDF